MEVGAVKQAFNNEVIHLKKNLNQAKIHVIHKLTRKAKTFTQKKTPEHLKEKLKRKAESAVNEVLILKKIKPKDIAKFIITHTGEVKDHLNKPQVDNDKACARLVLHKALQDKYKFIRNRFGNVPIKDLFMSRDERRKLKKEAREQQKNKKKGKEGKVVNAAGDWNVEDVDMGDDSKGIQQNDSEVSDDESAHSEIEDSEKSDIVNVSEIEDLDDIGDSIEINQENEHSNKDNSDAEATEDNGGDSDSVKSNGNNNDDHDDDSENEDAEVGKLIRLKPVNEKRPKNVNYNPVEPPEITSFKQGQKQIETQLKPKKPTNKKVKENKNKNLKEKLQSRTFKKEEDDIQTVGKKVVDPFFKTATGENYLSLAEPRQPDEIKEVHKQGNRQERRAAMFGHATKFKPRRDNFSHNNFRSSNKDGFDRNTNDRYNKNADFNDRNANFNDRKRKFNDRSESKFNDKNVNNSQNDEKKEEKLHPSWEAKKKLKASMVLKPFHGKKIVFNDD